MLSLKNIKHNLYPCPYKYTTEKTNIQNDNRINKKTVLCHVCSTHTRN